MKDYRFLLLAALLGASAAALTGCGGKKTSGDELASAPEGAAVEDDAVPFDDNVLFDLYVKIDETLQAGDTNAANAMFFDALEEPRFAPVSGQMFNTLIRYLLFTEQVELAQARFLARLRVAPDETLPASDFIYGWLLERGRTEDALDWARSLSTQDVPESLRVRAADWLASGLLEAGDGDGAIAAVADGLERFDPAVFSPVTIRLGDRALDGGNITWAERLLAALEASPRADAPEYATAGTILKLRILSAKDDWDGIAAALPAAASRAPDAKLSSAVSTILRKAEAAGAYEAADKIANVVVLDPAFAEAASTRNVAARTWLDAPFHGVEGGPAAFPARLRKLVAAQYQPSKLASWFSRHFYDILDIPDVLRETLEVGREIRATMPEEEGRNRFLGYELDGAFILGDYKKVVALIEGGIPDHDATWHEMTLCKAKAHLALSEERWSEAAELFQKFAAMLPDEDQNDPTSNLVYSRLTLVGNNEKRAATLWEKAGNAEKAAAARAAARKAYAEALETNKGGEETEAYIRKEAAELSAE